VIGVLAMAYGTPRARDDVEAYYTDIRRGQPPSAEQLADLVARYDAIGGTFPLRAITEAQCAALQRALDDIEPGRHLVALGQKHAAPRVEDGVRELAERGADRVVGLVLAPHYARMSVGEYAERAAAAGRRAGVPVDTVPSWHLLPAYLHFLAAAVGAALETVPTGSRVLFTAHSLPERILATGDPYPTQLSETAQAVADRVGLADWDVGWQSAGRTPEPWLRPDVLEVVRTTAEARTAPGLVVCPCGFVADHLEVAYDLDIEASGLARGLDLPFARTRSMNDDPRVMRGLAELVVAHSS
jgi:protoporphyrin/coproporphyrin ferrochelatase